MSVSMLARHHGYLEGVGGLRLHYRTWEPTEPRAAILVVHGLGDHGGRYARLGERLAGHEFTTFVPDLRGHGRSDGRRGHVSRFEVFLQDLDRFRREAQGLLDPDCPLFLLAHSLGALVALRYLEEFDAPIRAVVLASPCVAGGVPLARWGIALAGALDRVLPAVRLTTRLNAELLSSDPEVVAAYRDDPLVHDAVTPRLFRELSAATGLVLQRRHRIRVPLLFLLGEDDHIADPERTAGFVRSLAAVPLEVRRYPGRAHELLSGAEADDACADLVAWLEDRLEEGAVESAANAGTGLALGQPTHHSEASP